VLLRLLLPDTSWQGALDDRSYVGSDCVGYGAVRHQQVPATVFHAS